MPNNPVILRCRACNTLNRVPMDKLSNRPVCGQCKTAIDFPRAPLNVTTASFDQQINAWPEFVLAEFWAKWCGYCRMVEPFLTGLAAKRAGRLKIVKIDVDSEQALARRFTIKATPTFILYKNGRQLDRMDGAPAQGSDLELWLDRSMR